MTTQLFSKPILAPEFYCSRCRRYHPKEVKSSTLLCCTFCEQKVLKADTANDDDKVKSSRIDRYAVGVKKRTNDMQFNRELSKINDEWLSYE